MKTLSIRTKMTLWYTLMLMVFLTAAFAAFYLAVKAVLISHTEQSVIRDAVIIADEVEMERWGPRFDMDDDVRESLSGGLIYALYDGKGVWQDGRRSLWLDGYETQFEKIRTVKHNGEDWLLFDKEVYDDDLYVGYLRVLLPLSQLHQTLGKILFVGSAGFLPCLLLAAAGGLFIAEAALRPIRQITRTARLIGKGRFGERIDFSRSKDEVGELAEAFNEMSANIHLAFEREKRFTSDVSHEMRTPLAVIIVHAEEALQKEDITVYESSMRTIMEKSKQMQGIFSQMLQLARFYEQEEAMQPELLELPAVLEDIAEQTREQALSRKIRVDTDIDPGLRISADLLIFTRMMVNLLENAVKYGKDGGQILIQAHKSDAGIEITVSDDGQGIPEESLPYIFDRFYRVDKARKTSGSGLGLSFVEQAMRLHKGQIEVKSKPGQGSRFRLIFPKESGVVL